ncbi:hypothetical protein [Agarilytica rhodophyticola]|uniref:CIS tube protein n=1 Tax=Agarilytica rhodophyticola TaxID=1737490 RepID=UPI000B344734|nr:hypothetical protein [Agarilytica rhodophyticola]
MSIINDPTRAFLPIMKVTAFSDVQRTKKEGSIYLPYDTSALDSTYTNTLLEDDPKEGVSGSNRYKGSPSSDLNINFLLDDTTYSNLIAYALPNMLIPDSVDKLVKKLITLCYTHNSSTKEPNYVLLQALNMPLVNSVGGGFKGRLLNMSVKNEIINLLGNRVKAKVECSFKESLPPEELKKYIQATVK